MALLCAGIDPERYLQYGTYQVYDSEFYWRQEYYYQLEKLLTGEPRHCERWLPFLNGVEIFVEISEFFNKKTRNSNSQQIVNIEKSDSLGRREQQHEIILAVIAALEYESLQIPDGGKAKIKKSCLTRTKLFTDAGFEHAWKDGIKAGLFRSANHEKYSSG